MEAVCFFKRLIPALVIVGSSAGVLAAHEDDSDSKRLIVEFEPSVKNGDYNADGRRNITDAINMFQRLFSTNANPPEPVKAHCKPVDPPGSSVLDRIPTPSLENCDVNGDGSFDLSDCIYFLNWLFAGGPDPEEIECGALWVSV